MHGQPYDIVILGLSITSSWGNGHATTYRGLVRALDERGHQVLFLERDMPWYAGHRDLARLSHGRCELYRDLAELRERHAEAVRQADLVIVGSFVPEGRDVGRWVMDTARGIRAFYDIDTPVTLQLLAEDRCEYLDGALASSYDLYLSFTGGPVLDLLESVYGVRLARALHCAVDPEAYHPVEGPPRWDLGYLGTYAADRQPSLDRLLVEPARRLGDHRFVVAGPQYPDDLVWPPNVERIDHVAPDGHPSFYGSQRFTLNVTRQEMVRHGYAPSIRLFEAAACGCAVIGDRWPGIEDFFIPGEEILLADDVDDVLCYLTELPDEHRREIGMLARARVLASHTAAHRARELERYLAEAIAHRTYAAG